MPKSIFMVITCNYTMHAITERHTGSKRVVKIQIKFTEVMISVLETLTSN